MKKLLSRVSSLPIHPFLIAAFPGVFLYAQNVGETGWDHVVVAITGSVLCALVAWAALVVLLRDRAKAALATSMLVFVFFSYGHLYDFLGEHGVASIHRHSLLIPLLILVCGYACYFIRIAPWSFRSATRLLNVVAAVLIALNLGGALLKSLHGIEAPPMTVQVQAADRGDTTANSPASGPMPDIYYIVLDEYAHHSTMTQFYDYDNSRFADYLVEKGFFVADASRTRNPYTLGSLASTLNMQYVGYTQPGESVYELVSHNQVTSFLKSEGYRSVYLGNWYNIGRYNVDADVSYNFYESGYHDVPLLTGDFQGTLLNTTMLRPYYDYVASSRHESYLREGVIDTLEQLKTVPQLEGPKFVFAHILCPHKPFVFGPRGETVDYSDQNNWTDKQFYLGQFIYITEQIEDVLDTLISESATPPIIVLQSDHGLRSRPGLDSGIRDEWQKILNAYYLPAGNTEDLCDSISPVNSFRVIFNDYFGTDLALLDN